MSKNPIEAENTPWYSYLVGSLPSKEEYEDSRGPVGTYTILDRRGPRDSAPNSYIIPIRNDSDFYIGTEDLLKFCKVDN